MISFKGIYKPFDFLIYKTIRLWKLMGVFDEDNYYYLQLSGFISSFQLFSLLAIISCFLKSQTKNLIGFIILVVVFLGLMLFNFFRYRKFKLDELNVYWDNQTKISKWLLGLILLAYFSFSIICVFILVNSN